MCHCDSRGQRDAPGEIDPPLMREGPVPFPGEGAEVGGCEKLRVDYLNLIDTIVKLADLAPDIQRIALRDMARNLAQDRKDGR